MRSLDCPRLSHSPSGHRLKLLPNRQRHRIRIVPRMTTATQVRHPWPRSCEVAPTADPIDSVWSHLHLIVSRRRSAARRPLMTDHLPVLLRRLGTTTRHRSATSRTRTTDLLRDLRRRLGACKSTCPRYKTLRRNPHGIQVRRRPRPSKGANRRPRLKRSHRGMQVRRLLRQSKRANRRPRLQRNRRGTPPKLQRRHL